MAEFACASLLFTSFDDVPFLVCVDPKYLSWSTSTYPFVHALGDGLGFMLLMIILLLSELISTWYPVAILQQPFGKVFFFRWVVAVCLLEDWYRQQTTASCNAVVLQLTLRQWSVKVCCIVFSRNILNNTGDIGHPGRTPIVIWKKSPKHFHLVTLHWLHHPATT